MTLTKGFRAALAAAPLALLAFGSAAHAQTSLAFFDFNDTGTGTSFNQAAAFAADGGVFQATTNITTNFDSSTVTAFGGTTTNNTPPGGAASAAGNAIAFQGGTGAAGTTGGNNGNYFQFNTSSLGYNNLVLSFAVQGTGTGFTSGTLSYSVNGSAFTPTSFSYTPVASFTSPAGSGLQTFNLSTLGALNNASSIALRLTLTGATSSAGNNRFDNVQINGTAITGGGAAAPEPASIALVGLGVIGAVVARRRRK